MKKVLMAFFVIAAFVFSGCKNDKNAAENEVPVVVEEKKVQTYQAGALLYSGWDLYEMRDDGKMYAVQEAESGDKIWIFEDETGAVEQKIAVRHLSNGTEESMNFIHVLYGESKDEAEAFGAEFWARDIFVAKDGFVKTAVVFEDSYAYSTPDGISITKTKLEDGAVIVINDEKLDGFVHAKIYNGNPFGKDAYFLDTTVTTDAVGMELVKTLRKFDKDTKVEIADEIVEKMLDAWKIGSDASKVGKPGDEYFFKFLKDENRVFKISEEVMFDVNRAYEDYENSNGGF